MQHKKKICAGNETIIGDPAIFYDSYWHGIDGRETRSEPAVIGTRVWIVAGAILLKGVGIRDNSIIAAGSVVTKNIEGGVIVVGNRAKYIRKTLGYRRQ